jgi:hypothetical protein
MAGLLSIAPRARRSLGAYRIPSETGLLIPSEKRDSRTVGFSGRASDVREQDFTGVGSAGTIYLTIGCKLRAEIAD